MLAPDPSGSICFGAVRGDVSRAELAGLRIKIRREDRESPLASGQSE